MASIQKSTDPRTDESPLLQRCRYLVVGDYTHADFGGDLTGLADSEFVSDPQDAVAGLKEGRWEPDEIIIAQSRPQRHSAEVVEAIARLAPLSRVIACLGSWCEGETRTGTPWPGIRRVYWHQLQAELQLRNSAESSARAIPMPVCRSVDFHDEAKRRAEREGIDEQSGGPSKSGDQHLRAWIGISAIEAETYSSLAEFCHAAGYATDWIRPTSVSYLVQTKEGPRDAILWTGDATSTTDCERLGLLAQSTAPAPIVALLHFPRRSDVARVQQLGASLVMSLPCMLDNLHALLREALKQRGRD